VTDARGVFPHACAPSGTTGSPRHWPGLCRCRPPPGLDGSRWSGRRSRFKPADGERQEWQETVTVTGEGAPDRGSRPRASAPTNITQAQMEELPVNGRKLAGSSGCLAVGNKGSMTSSGPGHRRPWVPGRIRVNVDGQQITYEGGALGNVQGSHQARDRGDRGVRVSSRTGFRRGRRARSVRHSDQPPSPRVGSNTPSGSFGCLLSGTPV